MSKKKEREVRSFCPDCGAKLSFQIKGNTAEWACPNHGVIVATTYATEEEMDSSIYSVIITQQDASICKIKVLSKLSFKNYVECKKMLIEGGTFTQEEGWKLRPILEQLKGAGIEFITDPSFPYPLH